MDRLQGEMRSRALLLSTPLMFAAATSCADDSTLPSRAPPGVYGPDGGFVASGGTTGKGGSSPSSPSCVAEADVGLSTHTVDAMEETKTGLVVAAGQRITISATGKWCWGVGASDCPGPDGTPGRPTSSELPVVVQGASFGTLSMRVGSLARAVGSKLETTSPGCGELVLFMNDRPGYYGDNSGSLKVVVELSPPK